MCAITGILNLRDAPPPEEALVRRMLGTIRHRGPDQFGIYLGDGVALGNARLSIIDLEGGQQPISNEGQNLWIVFNGEIFNYLELRAELEARGHRFATHTDTEVLVHLYEDDGPACLSRLNGQWALAIWDERKRSLFLARDRLGVRPLFYARTGNRLMFGSEIKALFAVPEVAREIDPVGLDQVFTYWSAQAPQTCFRGIAELPPGCFLVADNGRVRVEEYWAVQFQVPGSKFQAPATSDDREPESPNLEPGTWNAEPGAPSTALAEQLRDLLQDAVRIRLRADVPVGAYLSGGLDSSIIAAIVRDLGVSRLDTFSIAFSDPHFDESEHQRRMAQFLGTDHQVVFATHEEIGKVFPEVVWHAETALMRTAPAPMYLLSRLVRREAYKVVLTGEGADEFLAGYDIFKETKVRRFWAQQPDSKWRPLLFERLYPDILNLSAAGASYRSSFFGAGLTEIEDPYYSHAIRWRNSRRCRRFFSDDFLSFLGQSRSAQPGRRSARPGTWDLELGSRNAERGTWNDDPPLPPGFRSWGSLEKAQYLEITTFLSTYLLSSQGDRMVMANSVEGRFPFLDHRVVEFCCGLPARMKLRALRDKHLLREVARNLIPPEISRRPKRPFRAPIQRSFFNAECEDYVRDLLTDDVLRRCGLFKPAAVRQLASKGQQGRPLGETDSMALVGILSGQLLHWQFVSEFPLAEPLSDRDDVRVVKRKH